MAKEHATVAQSTADDAKTTAEAAQEKAKATAAHFWSDAEGAHVTYTEEGEAIAGGNVLISTDGLSVRDGETTLASFGKELIQIGKDGGQNVQISPTALTLSGDGDEVTARIADRRTASSEQVSYYTGAVPLVAGSARNISLPITPVEDTEITVKIIYYAFTGFGNGYPNKSISFTSGTAATKQWQDVAFAYDGAHTISITIPVAGMIGLEILYTEQYAADDTALMSGNGTFKADWDGNITTAGLVNKMQAGNVLMTPGAETVTYNGIKYYKAIAKITFGTEFDEAPEVVIAPTTAVPYKMFVAPADVTATGFTIEFFRDSKATTGIHWIAMPRTQ